MKRVGKLISVIGVLAVLIAMASPAAADPITFDLMTGGDFGSGNIGLSGSATVDGLTLTMTAGVTIPRVANDPYYFSGASAWPDGSIYISDLGAGVQDAKLKGSLGISGKGGNKDEALILEFSEDIFTATFYFGDFDVTGKKPEMPSIYVGSPLSDGMLPSLGPTTIMDHVVFHDAGTLTGISIPVYSLDLSNPGLLWTGGIAPSSFNQIAFRNGTNEYDDGEEYYIALFNASTTPKTGFHAPEPGALILLGSGLVGLAGARIWRHRKD